MKEILSLLFLIVCLTMVTAVSAEIQSGVCGPDAYWSYDSSTRTLTITGTGKTTAYYTDTKENFNANYYEDEKSFFRSEKWFTIEKVVVSSGITQIGPGAFESTITYHYGDLKHVILPDTVTSIGAGAFAHRNGLTSIDLPKNLKKIGNSAFSDCSSLAQIVIPDGVEEIGNFAFSDCSGFEQIVIPDGVEIIGSGTFRNCSSLKNITLPQSLKEIGGLAFENCTSLEEINVPETTETIGFRAFANCTGLASLVFPDGLQSISGQAFAGCTHLENVLIPMSVKKINYDAFDDNPLTITCFFNSAAHQYADRKGFNVVLLDLTLCSDASINNTNTGAFSNGLNDLKFIQSLDYCDGNLLESDPSKDDIFYLIIYTKAEKTSTNTTITLPDGLSFSPESVIATKTCTLRSTYDNTLKMDMYKMAIPVYSVYAPQEGISQITVTATGGFESELQIKVRNCKKEIKLDGTTGVSNRTDFTEWQNIDWPVYFKKSILESHQSKLANLSCMLSFSVYNKEYFFSSLHNLGFHDVTYYSEAGIDGIDYCFGVKTLVNAANGDVKKVVAVVMRGTVTITEWIGNALNAISCEFDIAALRAELSLRDYLFEYTSIYHIPQENMAALVCGHSRGGAVANYFVHHQSLNFNCLAGYTFASPNVEVDVHEDNNLFNYCYAKDIVMHIPTIQRKHGQTYVFGVFDDVPDSVSAAFTQYTGGRVFGLPAVNPLLMAICKPSKIFTFLGDSFNNTINLAHSKENYLSWVINNGTKGCMSHEEAISILNERKIDNAKNAVSNIIDNTQRIVNNTKQIAISNMEAARDAAVNASEAVKAKMNQMIENAKQSAQKVFAKTAEITSWVGDKMTEMLSSFPKIKIFGIGCPVNISVYTADGILAATTENHIVTYCNEEYVYVLSVDDNDYLIIPEDQGYRIVITGAAHGSMDIMISSLDSSLESTNDNCYADVYMEAGEQFTLYVDESDHLYSDYNLSYSYGYVGEELHENEVYSLKQVLYLSNSLTRLEDSAFEGMSKIYGYIECPTSLVYIGSRVFSGTRINQILLSTNITTIADDAFEGTLPNLRIYAYPGYYAYDWAVSKGYDVYDANIIKDISCPPMPTIAPIVIH